MGNDNITAGMITVEKGRFKKNMYRSYSIKQTGGKQEDVYKRQNFQILFCSDFSVSGGMIFQ